MTRNEANESVVLRSTGTAGAICSGGSCSNTIMMSPGFVSADANASNVLSGGGEDADDAEQSCEAQIRCR